MRIKKKADIVYVAAIPQGHSGIGKSVPAHVRIHWLDEQGRTHVHLLEISDAEVAKIASLPNL